MSRRRTLLKVGLSGLGVTALALFFMHPLLEESASSAPIVGPSASGHATLLALHGQPSMGEKSEPDARGAAAATAAGGPGPTAPPSAPAVPAKTNQEGNKAATEQSATGGAAAAATATNPPPAPRARGSQRRAAARASEEYAGSAGRGFAPASRSTTPRDGEQEDDRPKSNDDEPELSATIATRIIGKVMSRRTNAGLPGAAVAILVFHPLAPINGAPNWVVTQSLESDAQGIFATTLEIPENPAPGAALGVVLQHAEHISPGGIPIPTISPGKDTSLGVFWLESGTNRVVGSVQPAHLAVGAFIADTGGLNPLAWDSRLRNSLLFLFPSRMLESADFSIDIAPAESVLGSRWLTCYQHGRWLATQSVVWGEEAAPDGSKVRLGRCDFVLGPETGLRGSVTTATGRGLSGAAVTALNPQAPQVSVTDHRGAFQFPRPPAGLRGFRVEHPEYLARSFELDPNVPSPTFVLDEARPDIPIRVTDAIRGQPVTRLRVTLLGTPASSGSPIPIQLLDLSAATGEYRITAAFRIQELRLSAEGFFPTSLHNPDNRPGQAIPIALRGARVIELTGRQAVARSGSGSAPSHGIYWWDHEASSLLAWSQENWLEFEFDCGAEATAFDFELGVRNHRIVDNQYRFEVRVELEGMQPQQLTILASETETRSARVTLPARTGFQRVRMTWLNDRWIPGQLDANIVVDWVKLHEREPDGAGR